MNNPNTLTGRTVLEKIKYYLTEIEKQITEQGGYSSQSQRMYRDDLLWCVGIIEEGGECTCNSVAYSMTPREIK